MKFFLSFLIALNLYAQTETPAMSPKAPDQLPTEVVPKPIDVKAEPKVVVKEEPKGVSSTAYLRENSIGTAMVGYEWMSTWVPSKVNLSYTHIFNREWSLEAEYSRGQFGLSFYGLDAFTVKEQRYSLIARRYTGNSFNWLMGITKNDFHVKLGDDFLEDMSNTSIDDFRVQSIGATLGLGNRWQWGSGFTFNIDWFRMMIPLFDKKVEAGVVDRIEDSSDAKDVKIWMRRMKNVPTFVIFGLKIGYTF